jgi:two-component sensor histidine kinase
LRGVLDTPSLLRYLPKPSRGFWRGQAIAATGVAVASLLRLLMDPYVAGVPFITYFPATVVVSVWGGSLAGISTLVAGGAIAAFFWLTPGYTFLVSGNSIGALVAFFVLGSLMIFMVHLLHLAVAALTVAERRADILAREMRHRVANVITLVQSISRLTARGTDTKAYQALFEARLQALAKAQELAAATPDLPVDLSQLLTRVLEPFDLSRFDLNGGAASLPNGGGLMAALLFHELGTNSMKYGSLSAPDGRVSIEWQNDGRDIRLEWRERGGPAVTAPARTGFGSRLAQSIFPPGGGEVSMSYEAAGLRCTVRFPVSAGAAETVMLPAFG